MALSFDILERNARAMRGPVFQKKDITLFSRGKRTRFFFTEDSHRYVTPREEVLRRGRKVRIDRGCRVDGAFRRYEAMRRSPIDRERVRFAQWEIRRSMFRFRACLVDAASGVSFPVSPVRAWNFSVVGAVVFGMISMNIISKSLGQTVSAERDVAGEEVATLSDSEGEVLGEAIEFIQKTDAQYRQEQKRKEEQAEKRETEKERQAAQRRAEFEEQIRDMVSGYPIEEMLPALLKQNEIVAAYLVAIAKKESNWGRRVPVLHGKDCYNYWGYRAQRERMGSGGHTCFDNPEDAVETVGARIAWFVHQKNRQTPEELIVWKCGFSCDGHSSYSVKKWIADVDLYFSKLYKEDKED